MLHPSLRTTRIALTHAILTSIHPSIPHNSPIPFPVHLPPELHALIRSHLRVHIARSLLESLHASLSSTLSTFCNDCKSYHAHVFGPRVVDWPVIRAGRGCQCADIGLQFSPCRTDTACSNENHFELRSPVADKEPPAYFLVHVQHTLATYTLIDPNFPYADKPVTTSADLDALLSRVLSTFGCRLVPAPTTGNWEVDNVVLIVPFSCPPDGEDPLVTLSHLQVELELSMHTDMLARSTLHPMKTTYRPPIRPHRDRGKSPLCYVLPCTEPDPKIETSTVAPSYSSSLSAAVTSFTSVVVAAVTVAYALKSISPWSHS
ncbi:hypothetical protein BU15DRAFT_70775 [Melanogaster broomeanus]|nr:hypothetical protein BU15DRAFT_70775 [Melanogaster broomeanus]